MLSLGTGGPTWRGTGVSKQLGTRNLSAASWVLSVPVFGPLLIIGYYVVDRET